MVELVIVIAIIVILLALLLSGVQKVMEMTNQFKCANNLRQLSSGFIAHQTQYGNFPDGGESGNPLSYPRLLDANGVPYATPNQNLGWGYQVLPFIELTTVWSIQSQANNDMAVRGKVIPLFFCPRRRSPRTNYDSRWGNIATTDYAGNGGVEQTPVVGAFLGNGLNGVVVRRPNPADSTRSLPVNQGNISDGASNTLMLGEKYLDLKNMAAAQANTNAQLPDADAQGYTSGWDRDAIRWGNNAPARDQYLGYPVNSNSPYDYVFGSSHPFNFNAIFADGSLHRIPYTIDPVLWQHICQRNDGFGVNLSGM